MTLPAGTKVVFTQVAVVIATGAATGSSAANPDLAAQSRIAGAWPTGVATTTGWGLLQSIVLNADGSVTATTRANVATADLNITVSVETVSNS